MHFVNEKLELKKLQSIKETCLPEMLESHVNN